MSNWEWVSGKRGITKDSSRINVQCVLFLALGREDHNYFMFLTFGMLASSHFTVQYVWKSSIGWYFCSLLVLQTMYIHVKTPKNHPRISYFDAGSHMCRTTIQLLNCSILADKNTMPNLPASILLAPGCLDNVTILKNLEYTMTMGQIRKKILR